MLSTAKVPMPVMCASRSAPKGRPRTKPRTVSVPPRRVAPPRGPLVPRVEPEHVGVLRAPRRARWRARGERAEQRGDLRGVVDVRLPSGLARAEPLRLEHASARAAQRGAGLGRQRGGADVADRDGREPLRAQEREGALAVGGRRAGRAGAARWVGELGAGVEEENAVGDLERVEQRARVRCSSGEERDALPRHAT